MHMPQQKLPSKKAPQHENSGKTPSLLVSTATNVASTAITGFWFTTIGWFRDLWLNNPIASYAIMFLIVIALLGILCFYNKKTGRKIGKFSLLSIGILSFVILFAVMFYRIQTDAQTDSNLYCDGTRPSVMLMAIDGDEDAFQTRSVDESLRTSGIDLQVIRNPNKAPVIKTLGDSAANEKQFVKEAQNILKKYNCNLLLVGQQSETNLRFDFITADDTSNVDSFTTLITYVQKGDQTDLKFIENRNDLLTSITILKSFRQVLEATQNQSLVDLKQTLDILTKRVKRLKQLKEKPFIDYKEDLALLLCLLDMASTQLTIGELLPKINEINKQLDAITPENLRALTLREFLYLDLMTKFFMAERSSDPETGALNLNKVLKQAETLLPAYSHGSREWVELKQLMIYMQLDLFRFCLSQTKVVNKEAIGTVEQPYKQVSQSVSKYAQSPKIETLCQTWESAPQLQQYNKIEDQFNELFNVYTNKDYTLANLYNTYGLFHKDASTNLLKTTNDSVASRDHLQQAQKAFEKAIELNPIKQSFFWQNMFQTYSANQDILDKAFESQWGGNPKDREKIEREYAQKLLINYDNMLDSLFKSQDLYLVNDEFIKTQSWATNNYNIANILLQKAITLRKMPKEDPTLPTLIAQALGFEEKKPSIATILADAKAYAEDSLQHFSKNEQVHINRGAVTYLLGDIYIQQALLAHSPKTKKYLFQQASKMLDSTNEAYLKEYGKDFASIGRYSARLATLGYVQFQLYLLEPDLDLKNKLIHLAKLSMYFSECYSFEGLGYLYIKDELRDAISLMNRDPHWCQGIEVAKQHRNKCLLDRIERKELTLEQVNSLIKAGQ
jgi:hypothetical protein